MATATINAQITKLYQGKNVNKPIAKLSNDVSAVATKNFI